MTLDSLHVSNDGHSFHDPQPNAGFIFSVPFLLLLPFHSFQQTHILINGRLLSRRDDSRARGAVENWRTPTRATLKRALSFNRISKESKLISEAREGKSGKKKVRGVIVLILGGGRWRWFDPMAGKKRSMGGQVLDGSDIMKLVGNEEAFGNFVDHKFKELDFDHDGKLSVRELQPVVADIGVALGLPAKGTSSESDHIYSEFLDEFTHGKEGKVSKTEFKEVLSDILLGMAAGLKRDPIVILRIDGEDLQEFISSPTFETEMVSIFSEVESPDATLRELITKALEKLTVDQGLPPTSDSWVMSQIVEPALQSCTANQSEEQPAISQETFLKEFKKTAENIVVRLQEQPVIVAHSENTFDGSGIRRLLGNKFELEKALNTATEAVPQDRHGKMCKEYLRVALDSVAPSAGLPPYGALDEMDKVTNDVFKMVDADDGKLVKEEEFKKLLLEILGSIMLQLEGNPISVSSNSVVQEPIASASSLLQTSSS